MKVDPNKFARDAAYREIREVNYAQYSRKFLLPYLIARGLVTNRADMVSATDLETSTDALRDNPKVRVQICDDDFVLTPADIAWFHSTFGHELTEYREGGHLGNLYRPEVQDALAKLFSDQK
jgi:hypothetical protein